MKATRGSEGLCFCRDTTSFVFFAVLLLIWLSDKTQASGAPSSARDVRWWNANSLFLYSWFTVRGQRDTEEVPKTGNTSNSVVKTEGIAHKTHSEHFKSNGNQNSVSYYNQQLSLGTNHKHGPHMKYIHTGTQLYGTTLEGLHLLQMYG